MRNKAIGKTFLFHIFIIYSFLNNRKTISFQAEAYHIFSHNKKMNIYRLSNTIGMHSFIIKGGYIITNIGFVIDRLRK